MLFIQNISNRKNIDSSLFFSNSISRFFFLLKEDSLKDTLLIFVNIGDIVSNILGNFPSFTLSCISILNFILLFFCKDRLFSNINKSNLKNNPHFILIINPIFLYKNNNSIY